MSEYETVNKKHEYTVVNEQYSTRISVRAENFGLDEGVLMFHLERKLVASFAPGQWSYVVRSN